MSSYFTSVSGPSLKKAIPPPAFLYRSKADTTVHRLWEMPRARRWRWYLSLDWWDSDNCTTTLNSLIEDIKRLKREGIVHWDYWASTVCVDITFSDRDQALAFAVRHDPRLAAAWLP